MSWRLWVLIVGWLGCGALGARITYMDFRGDFPNDSARSDAGFGVYMGLILGPLWLLVSYCASGFAKHGVFRMKR